jgi:DNA-binding transcriptional ArsR family regulator
MNRSAQRLDNATVLQRNNLAICWIPISKLATVRELLVEIFVARTFCRLLLIIMQLDHVLDNLDAGADLLGVLSHPGRFLILRFIANREVSVRDIVEFVGESQTSVSMQLAKLRKRNLVATRRDSHTIFYTCEHRGILLLMREIDRLFPTCGPTSSRGKKRQTRRS